MSDIEATAQRLHTPCSKICRAQLTLVLSVQGQLCLRRCNLFSDRWTGSVEGGTVIRGIVQDDERIKGVAD